MPLTRRAALLAPLALTACGGGPVTHRFREANDHLVTRVAIAGRETLALLDNGAPMTSLDERFAVGLPSSPTGMGLLPFDMRFGEAAVRVHPFTEDMTEAAIAADAPLGALVGMELFDAFAVAFSFTRGELALHRRQGFRPDAAALTLDTDLGPAPHPSVQVALEGRRANAFVDLGCSAAVAVSPALAEALGLDDGRLASTRQVILSNAGGLGLGASRLTSLKTVEFAGRQFRDVPVDVLPQEAKAFTGLDAVIGVPLLRMFDLAFDLPGRIALTPNARAGQAFERRMTGLQTKPSGPNLLVRHVAPGSPAAAAGFAAGDLIAAIDGAPPQMRTLRNAREGQTLSIRLADGAVRAVTGARYY